MNRLLALVLVLLSTLLVSACGPDKPPFNSVDITGADYARGFSLVDHSGVPRALGDFKGKAVVVFFGFTQCPDVCPTTMTQMASVMQSLGKDADRVQVIFITLDPERDTPALLAEYVPNFDKRFLGLHGDLAAIDKTAKEFKIYAAKVPGKTPGSYSIDHTAGTYVFDTEGRVRLFIRHGLDPAPIAQDLNRLLAE